MRIKGRIIQIINPEKRFNYMSKPDAPFYKHHFTLVIEREDYPIPNIHNIFKRFLFRIKHRHEQYCWIIATLSNNYYKNDIIDIDCKHYYEKTLLLIEKEK